MKKVLIGLLTLGSISSFAQATDNHNQHNEYDRKFSIAAVVFDCATEYKNADQCKSSVRKSFSLDISTEELLIAIRQELAETKPEDHQVSENSNRFSETFNEADEAFTKKMNNAEQAKRKNRFEEILKKLN